MVWGLQVYFCRMLDSYDILIVILLTLWHIERCLGCLFLQFLQLSAGLHPSSLSTLLLAVLSINICDMFDRTSVFSYCNLESFIFTHLISLVAFSTVLAHTCVLHEFCWALLRFLSLIEQSCQFHISSLLTSQALSAE